MSWEFKVGTGVYLTQSQMENNAKLFKQYFQSKGVTLESICGMLGNIQQESGLNPGIKQTASTSSGWGLIQWTPSTVLTDWCNTYGYTWYDGDVQCLRIWSEGTNEMDAGGTFIPTKEYPYTWSEFCALTNVDEATKAYLYERERAGDEKLENRLEYARKWYEFLKGETPVEEIDILFLILLGIIKQLTNYKYQLY